MQTCLTHAYFVLLFTWIFHIFVAEIKSAPLWHNNIKPETLKWSMGCPLPVFWRKLTIFLWDLIAPHDIQCKYFPCYWPFVKGIPWWLVDSPHKGQWCRALMFSSICDWTLVTEQTVEKRINTRCHWTHYDVAVVHSSCKRPYEDSLDSGLADTNHGMLSQTERENLTLRELLRPMLHWWRH